MTVENVVVPREAGGERLDRFVAEHSSVGSRAAAARLIDAGAVVVDGEVRPRAHRVSAGAVVRLTVPEPEQAPLPDEDVEVVHADERLLAVVKPAGLLVHAVPGHAAPTLAAALAGRAGGGPPGRAGIVHRLDRDTSGLLLVARDDDTLRRLQAQLRRRHIRRAYTALVRGRPPSRAGRIEAPIGRDRRDPARQSLDTDHPRDAVTHFELVEALPERSLLRVELETGRTHQIRVHLAAIGHPVVGDPVYGHGAELGLERQFLHASELRFTHPWTGEELRLSAPLPADLEAALGLARSV
ncbi:MAG TPA: RluA family pseudouridine synthase [Gaiellales bacterium]|nr:RluA family pseudouridine synthase [Gaiellales bacterium]